MARLRTIKPKLPMAASSMKSVTTRDNRMTGRKLQDRRLRIWRQSPRCAGCGALTIFPHGFELDHKVPLFMGGHDTDENCQVLCVERHPDGSKAGCHSAKSASEARG